MRSSKIVALAVLLCGCSQSVDDRFATACAEQKVAGRKFAETSASLCGEDGKFLSPQEKEHLISAWDQMKAAIERAADHDIHLDEEGNFVPSTSEP